MPQLLMLLLLSLGMLVGSLIAGFVPLFFSFSSRGFSLVSLLGAGLLTGTVLTVIVPEGIESIYDAAKRTGNGDNEGTAGGSADINAHIEVGLALVLGFIIMLLIDRCIGSHNHAHHHHHSGDGGNGDLGKDSVTNALGSRPLGNMGYQPPAEGRESIELTDNPKDNKRKFRRSTASSSHASSSLSPAFGRGDVSSGSNSPAHIPGRDEAFGFTNEDPLTGSTFSIGAPAGRSQPQGHVVDQDALEQGDDEDKQQQQHYGGRTSPGGAVAATGGLCGIPSTIIGIMVHAAADGIAMGAAAASFESAVETILFIALTLHKAPEAFGLATTLLQEGFPRDRLKRWIIAFSFAAPITAIVSYLVLCLLLPSGASSSVYYVSLWSGRILLFSGSTFLYVALCHTLPEAMDAASVGSGGRLGAVEAALLVGGMAIPFILAIVFVH